MQNLISSIKINVPWNGECSPFTSKFEGQKNVKKHKRFAHLSKKASHPECRIHHRIRCTCWQTAASRLSACLPVDVAHSYELHRRGRFVLNIYHVKMFFVKQNKSESQHYGKKGDDRWGLSKSSLSHEYQKDELLRPATWSAALWHGPAGRSYGAARVESANSRLDKAAPVGESCINHILHARPSQQSSRVMKQGH